MAGSEAKSDKAPRRALVLGGSGTVGSAVLRGLAAAGVPAAFTYFSGEARAAELVRECGHRAYRVDLTSRAELRALFPELLDEGPCPDLFFHCAAVSSGGTLAELGDGEWDRAVAVNCTSAIIAAQELARRVTGCLDIVLCGALDRAQSLPLPVHFAATQGMLPALAMALAKELGPRDGRVNVLALGALGGGVSTSLTPAQLADYRAFSALRRTGTAEEAARAALWLGLHNTYMSGKVLSVNGGI
jgi:3-oxoacyl-[acyl-carrier protein] reductase